ncbi:remorin [Artemisia annua]|uniref:Remorin n=1 Tax=Artemisia annua TaxID=35608 RepID=A0A2U1MG12_ARTAN|nr:remorin [Artemisia annua]
MANMINQKRVSLSEHGQHDNKESFKDKWFHEGNSQDYDSIDSEYVAAIAAATFVVHSLEEKSSSQHQRREKTREEDSLRTRTSQIDRALSLARPSRPRDPYVNRNLSIRGSGNTNVDTWERNQLLKIKKRYEKNNLTILEWENEKKTRAKRRMEEKKVIVSFSFNRCLLDLGNHNRWFQ